MTEMLKINVGGETFFDAEDSFLSEESFSVREDSECANISYEIWCNELMSVKERREIFFNRMGFLEESSSANGCVTLGVDTVVEWSRNADKLYVLDKNLVRDTTESCGEPKFVDENFEQESPVYPYREASEYPCITEQFQCNESQADIGNFKNIGFHKKSKHWWRTFVHKTKKRKDDKSKAQKLLHNAGEVTQMKVEKSKKKCKELTALYAGQEICAHKGLIRTMKFSRDGQYLATGGEDGVLRVWGVTSVNASSVTSECNFHSHRLESKSSFRREKSSHASVVVPKKIVRIAESPLHEFHGHSSDILDIAWSTSNKLLSASMDNTVRLWHLGSDKCQSVFLHCDYVTSIQFNPVDENYFTSGSVDGKVRVWGVSQKRVVKWADVHDIISVVCYQPNGEGILTGSFSGICRFYEVSGSELLPSAEICIHGKRKSGNKITGIQFLESSSQLVMVTSEDSKIRILNGLDVIHKYKGPTKSGSQTSALLTPSRQHILSVGEDSRIYMWNFDDPPIHPSKPKKSTRSCEHFFSEGVSVALPWPGTGAKVKRVGCQQTCNQQDSYFSVRDSEQFSLSSWFSMNISSKSSVTWPEEKLPVLEMPYGEQADELCNHHRCHLEQTQLQNSSGTWGLVIVTAGWDGMIRTYHNYGLPTRT